MTPMFKKIALGLSAFAVVAISGTYGIANAAGAKSEYKMEHVHWHFNGPRGSYDRAAVQRGFQVYREVCAACHSLDYLSFRHLGDKGGPYYSEDFKNPNDNPYVKAFAADWSVQDIDGETGDVIERPGTPADKFPQIFANEAAARASNAGALPPDLSLIVAARGGGADYVYNLLTAYGLEAPKDLKLSGGLHYNPVMEGGAIAMAAPLFDGLVEYAPIEVNDHGKLKTIPAPDATVEQMAKDVTEFLAWSSDPKMEQRKSLGFATMIYLLILSILLYFSYKAVWRNVEH